MAKAIRLQHSRRSLWVWGGVIVLILLLLGSVGPYCDYLWFLHDARQPAVFLKAITTRSTIFTVAFVASLIFCYLNLGLAARTTFVYDQVPETPGERIISNVLSYVQRQSGTVAKVGSVFIALLSAIGLSSAWNSYLINANSVKMGSADPLFGADLSFFIFRLPWLEALSSFVFGLVATVSVVTLAMYLGVQGLATLAKIQVGRPAVKLHISGLIAICFFSLAWKVWLARYGMVTAESRQFTGAGYAGVVQLGSMSVLAFLLAAAGLVVIAANRARKPFNWAAGSATVICIWYVVACLVYPGVVQRFSVDPDKLSKEGPYSKYAIRMTRDAYALNEAEVRETDAAERPSSAELDDAKATLSSMRLWDPEVMRQAAEGIQSLRPYYRFNDVDIDRYMIDGVQTPVMIAPRDIDADGLSDNSRTWLNQRLQYTHGYGLIAARVDAASATGRPFFLVKDIPPKISAGLEIKQPRVYFSDFRDGFGQDRDEYALVNTQLDEFDFPDQSGETRYRWTAKHGVPVGGPLTKLALSMYFSDGNLLVSRNITGNTRLLFRRSILKRAELVYPFLKFDNDPYLVITQGRLVWVIDGYTTSDRYPYSATTVAFGTTINYIRNSAKITIDAYSGEMTAYAVAKDPVLETYRRIYPGLIENADKVPDDIRQHFRYPEDLVTIQALQLAQYHVEDPIVFLNNEDAWEISAQRGLGGSKEVSRPYYVRMVLPGEKSAEFVQMLPMSPRQRNNLSGWLAARCDGPNYGKLIVYRYPKTRNINGPAQMEAFFNQNKEIADINRQLNNDQSQIIVGNMLVVPIGRSVLYVESLFLQSRSVGIQPIPELRKVILGIEGKVVVGDTYQEALSQLFGTEDVVPTESVEPQTKPTTSLKTDVRRAADLLKRADEALRKGDFAAFGSLQKEARRVLEAASRQSGDN